MSPPDRSAAPLPGLESFTASPLRRQYVEIKQRHPDAILFFRLGDFFETFEEDARLMARELEITLTSRDFGRGERVPMAGIPCQAAESYIARLVARGHRIAICEQVGEAPLRGLVDRRVVRVITPGTLTEDALLPAQSNNYLAALVSDHGRVGLAMVDISTGELAATEIDVQGDRSLLHSTLSSLSPAELLVRDGSPLLELVPPDTHLTIRDDTWGDERRSLRVLIDHFQVDGLEGLGLAEHQLAAWAAGKLVAYVRETQPAALHALTGVELFAVEGRMVLDANARRGLELLANQRTGTRDGSLLGVLDRTTTSMGARLLRSWVAQPLVRLEPLIERQQQVAELVGSAHRPRLVGSLQATPDMERLAARSAQRLLSPRDCMALARGLALLPEVRSVLQHAALPALEPLLSRIDPCPELHEAITATIADQPPASVGEGVIRAGVSAELDELRALAGDARGWLVRLERQEKERSGVRALKVGYNRVFGYYIEISSAVLRQSTDYYQREQSGAATVGEHLEHLGYVRRQTLVNAERYVTQELKEYEARAQRAQEDTERLERQLYQALLERIAEHAYRLTHTARALAHLDALLSLAEVAVQHRYTRPELTLADELCIEHGRHPVVELALPRGEFVQNDVDLSCDQAQIVILTGPNMAGKSTYIRQVAVLVLMAQIGSFVPARAARVGLVDRIFTRIGSQDDIASGRSTFMVEMQEVAAILRNATRRSLVILDEVGRGTSTYDGVAIARAVIEHLHEAPHLGCKTLFATHYHELAELEAVLPRARAFRMEVLEQGDQVAFLHRVVPGGADRSYGIHVAFLAGVPDSVTNRARAILRELEHRSADAQPAKAERGVASLARPQDAAAEVLRRELAATDVEQLTPLDALNQLYRLVHKARGPD